MHWEFLLVEHFLGKNETEIALLTYWPLPPVAMKRFLYSG